ncbi:hypothetical protein I2H36_15820 [Microvirga sp. BT290]|uniref:Uncharacterized protein n=1 Tax=Microvirga terrestris TaxID=2791024 RepID=A0ABS0HVK4_9HYPH|nr:hypothetical protein [Microvirga terrestris]
MPSFFSCSRGIFSMHKRSDIPRPQPENPEAEHYKMLARLAEDRAREIRRITALERARLEERLLEQEPTIRAYAEEQERLRGNYERLKASSQRLKDKSQQMKAELAATRMQLKALQKAQQTLDASRAHRLAAAYVRFASNSALSARILQVVRPVGRVLNRFRHMLT